MQILIMVLIIIMMILMTNPDDYDDDGDDDDRDDDDDNDDGDDDDDGGDDDTDGTSDENDHKSDNYTAGGAAVPGFVFLARYWLQAGSIAPRNVQTARGSEMGEGASRISFFIATRLMIKGQSSFGWPMPLGRTKQLSGHCTHASFCASVCKLPRSFDANAPASKNIAWVE